MAASAARPCGSATLALVLLGCAVSGASRVRVVGRQLLVNNEPFHIRGICYSPTPINESVYFAPYGDYFTSEFSFIWLRDLPLIKAMGVNVVRTYGWQPANDHTQFLDAVAAHGLYAMTTFYMGTEEETPVGTAVERAKIISQFATEVGKYAGHPSLLLWSFGNELNGVWNGFLQALGKDKTLGGAGGDPKRHGECMWDDRYDDLGGCWIHKGKKLPMPGVPSEWGVEGCYEASYCVYSRLFTLINDAAVAAKAVADVVVVSAFADVDALYDKVGRAGDFAEDVDAWTAQVYRGNTFGDFFATMGLNADKPVLLTEYGVDAYHDVCGMSPANATPCYNTYGDKSGSYVDEESQSAYAYNLTLEIDLAAADKPACTSAKKGSKGTEKGECSCIGGFLMSWTDEYWKGAKSQASCAPTKGNRGFSPKHCDPKAHVTCGNWDSSDHDLCGYQLDAAPDHYVNEEWFGITTPAQCAKSSIDALQPRKTYWTMREHWTGQGSDSGLFSQCDAMIDGHCAALGDGGTAPTSWLETLVAPFLRAAAGVAASWKANDAAAAAAAAHAAPAAASTSTTKGRSLSAAFVTSLAAAAAPPRRASTLAALSSPPPPSMVCSGHGSCTADWKECGSGNFNASATPCCSCDIGYAGVGCSTLDVRVYVAAAAVATLGVLLVAMLGSSLVGAIAHQGLAASTSLKERLLP